MRPNLACVVTLCIALAGATPFTCLGQPTTLRVSVATDGTQNNWEPDGYFYAPSLSADGRYVAFETIGSSLMPGDTNCAYDVFIRDTEEGVTSCVSLNPAMLQASDGSGQPILTPDAGYLAFASAAADIVPGDMNSAGDVFIRELRSQSTKLVSVASNGEQGNGWSFQPSPSSDGHRIAFASLASNLVADDTNQSWDVFVRDMQTGNTTRVSMATGGTQGNADSAWPSLSADGRYVVFASLSSNLVPADTNGASDVFIHDTKSGATTCVSEGVDGTPADGFSDSPAVSADGRFVAFRSCASNLGEGLQGSGMDIYVRDVQTGLIRRVSSAPDGTPGWCEMPSISADGRYVAFQSFPSSIFPSASYWTFNVYVSDLDTGLTTLASASPDGAVCNGDSYAPAISADGRYVAFRSDATNLVAGDTNGGTDIFLRGPLFDAAPYTLADAAAALRAAGGLTSLTNAQNTRLALNRRLASDHAVRLADAIGIARRVAGLESDQ